MDGDEVGDGVEHAATDGLVDELRNQPRPCSATSRRWAGSAGGSEGLGQPATTSVPVGDAVVAARVHQQALGDLPVDHPEELEERGVPIPREDRPITSG